MTYQANMVLFCKKSNTDAETASAKCKGRMLLGNPLFANHSCANCNFSVRLDWILRKTGSVKSGPRSSIEKVLWQNVDLRTPTSMNKWIACPSKFVHRSVENHSNTDVCPLLILHLVKLKAISSVCGMLQAGIHTNKKIWYHYYHLNKIPQSRLTQQGEEFLQSG